MIGDLPTFFKKLSSSEWQVEEQLRLFQFIKTNGFPSCAKDWLDLGKVLQNKSPNRIRAIVQKLLEVESSTPSDASTIATITPQELLLIIGELNRIDDESLSNCVIAHILESFVKNSVFPKLEDSSEEVDYRKIEECMSTFFSGKPVPDMNSATQDKLEELKLIFNEQVEQAIKQQEPKDLN